MKRNLNENEIEPKRRKMQNEPLLHDDLVYEVGKWLSSSFLLSSCVLVCKQWKRVIEKRFDFEFELDELQTSQFILKKEYTTPKIISLSLSMGREMREFRSCHSQKHFFIEDRTVYTKRHLFGEITTDEYGRPLSNRQVPTELLQSIKHLKHLSLYGFSLSKDSIEKIAAMSKLKSLAIKLCKFRWADLEPFVSNECHLSIDLGYNGEYASGSNVECFEIVQRIYRSKSLYLALYVMHSGMLECSAEMARTLSTDLSRKVDNNLPITANAEALREVSDREISSRGLGSIIRSDNLKSIVCGPGLVYRNNAQLHTKPGPSDKILNQATQSEIGAVNSSKEDLIDPHCLRRLEMLELHSQTVPASFKFPSENLASLTLGMCNVDEDTAHSIRLLHKLTHLSLNGTRVFKSDRNHVRDITFDDLCYQDEEGNPQCNLIRLKEVTIALPPKTSRALSVLPLMKNLHRLCLLSREIVSISDEHMEQIASATSVTDLGLTSRIGVNSLQYYTGGVMISEKGGRCLLSMHQLKRLRIVSPLFDHVLLDSISLMHNLKRLDLCTAIPYRDADVGGISDSSHNVETSSIDLRGLEKVASMKNLSLLHVDISALKEASVGVLLRMSHLKYLYITCQEEDYASIEIDLVKSNIANHVTVYHKVRH